MCLNVLVVNPTLILLVLNVCVCVECVLVLKPIEPGLVCLNVFECVCLC
jgi:hypothetical protein